MNKQSEKVTESLELIRDLYEHWLLECATENLTSGSLDRDLKFAHEKYHYYKDLLEARV